MNDPIEQEILNKGLTAPRITLLDVQDNIVEEDYFTAAQAAAGREYLGQCNPPHPLDLLTICVLTLKNGFTVTGESACASPENFDAELGRKIAKQNAISKIFPLMGYELKQRLYQQQQVETPSALELLEMMQKAAPDMSCSIELRGKQDRDGPGLLLVWNSYTEREKAYRFIPLQLIREAKGDLFGAEINKITQYIKEKRD
jgi:hypothetical protein